MQRASFLFSSSSRRFYHKNVIDHYENPRNVGSFNKKDKILELG